MWQNSQCNFDAWLHEYRQVRRYPNGSLEICAKCGDREFFRDNTPNHIYLSYHLRSALQTYDKNYAHEYGKTK